LSIFLITGHFPISMIGGALLDGRTANRNRIKATQLISPHSMFSCMGLRPMESDYLLKTEDRHKAPSRKMLSHPDFVPFRPQDSNGSVQIGKVGL
jgi:hypothetical protein